MNGILNINKPLGITSFDVVAILRKTLKLKRIGHTGTLDPEASGVLPICVGKATSAVDYIINKNKKYEAGIKFGIRTDTGDSVGKILEEKPVDLTKEQIESAILSFVGKIKQVPPMYSALKIGGKKLCDLARKGIVIERQARDIEIFNIEILDIQKDSAIFAVNCSKGTYIRTLCEDIGEKLGCGAFMKSLKRTEAGKFSIDNSVTLEQVKEAVETGKIDEMFMRVDEVFYDFLRFDLDDSDYKRYINGAKVVMKQDFKNAFQEKEIVRVYHNDLFLGLGNIIISIEGFFLKSQKLFI